MVFFFYFFFFGGPWDPSGQARIEKPYKSLIKVGFWPKIVDFGSKVPNFVGFRGNSGSKKRFWRVLGPNSASIKVFWRFLVKNGLFGLQMAIFATCVTKLLSIFKASIDFFNVESCFLAHFEMCYFFLGQNIFFLALFFWFFFFWGTGGP